MKTIIKKMINEAIAAGWREDQARKGYDVFGSDYMGGALHIERIDIMDVFNTDLEASEQAEKDGIKLINDLPDCIDDEDMARFIDTQENRKIISKHIKKKYNVDWK